MRGVALTDQSTLGHQRAADAAGDRSRDGGVAQAHVRVGHGSLASSDLSVSSLLVGHGHVVFLLADGVRLDQRLVAAGGGRCLRQIRLGLSQRGLRALQIGLVRRAVDLEQHLTGLHVRAFLEAALLHDASSAGTNLRNAGSFQATRQIGDHGHVLQLDRDHAHFRRLLLALRGLLLLGLLVTTGRQAQRSDQRQHERCRFGAAKHNG